MVVANRLSEDPNVSVLVLEAGDLDNEEDFIVFPIDDGNGLWTKYDWNLFTTPQTYLDGAIRPYDMGRGIGGGSLINGMCWTRGGRADYDAWVALGNPGWGWDDLLPYFKKSENYTDNVNADFSRELYIHPDASTYGADGYVHVSYPRYFYNQSQLFLDGLQELGIPILTDPNNGTASGGMLIPDSISPDNQTRSYARLDYYDTFVNTRSNLHVVTRQHVTRVLIDILDEVIHGSVYRERDLPASLWITGVEFLTDGSLELHNVSCSREVILAAGNVHTPQILEMSGIGDPSIIKEFDIEIAIDLPGVGNNFQDHPYVGVVYSYRNTSYFNIEILNNDASLLGQVELEYYLNKTGPWTAGAINTVAFPSLASTSQNWTNMINDAAAQSTTQHLIPNLDPTIIAGYEAQKRILVDLLNNSGVAAYELLNDNRGLLAVAAMHTFSRGNIHIQSTDPLQQPLVDPRYCSNPLDCQILAEGLLFNNKLLNTTSMRVLEPSFYSPFLPNATANVLMPAINSGIRTEFHGTGATSMLPRELGGVVDPRLRVYGAKNLRIVDTGIFPLVPASHLQAPVYAVAEKAADIIKADNAGLATGGCGTNSTFARPGPVFSNISISEQQLTPGKSSSGYMASNLVNGASTASKSPAILEAAKPSSSTEVLNDAIMDAANLFVSFLASELSTPSMTIASDSMKSISTTQVPHFNLPSGLLSALSSVGPTQTNELASAPTSNDTGIQHRRRNIMFHKRTVFEDKSSSTVGAVPETSVTVVPPAV